MNQRFLFLLVFLLISLLSACDTPAASPSMLITVQADGREITFSNEQAMTVESFLVQAGFQWDENDRIVPPLYTQVLDGTRITIVRIEETETCELEDIPYQVERIPNEAFRPDEQVVTRQGVNGQQRVCYRIISENGIQQERMQIRQAEIIVEPANEQIVVGISQEVEPIDLIGTLAYINNGNAWVIKGHSRNKRPLTTTSDLDSLVLSLSADGRYLLYTREPQDAGEFVNELWLKDTSGQIDAVSLNTTDVLIAEWMPNREATISYSTGEAQEVFPGWRALNNVWLKRIDPLSGNSLEIRRVLDESVGGLYSWWGTVYRWSPDGERLAWVEADGVGWFDSDGRNTPLLEYASFRSTNNWSWRANIGWSTDGDLLATTVHGKPLGNEPADTTPVFDIVVTDSDGNFEALVVERAGMWASPQFSPTINNPNSQYPQGYLAYLKARDPDNSVYGEYDLVVADRDGSNARVLFPPIGRLGITWSDSGITPIEYTWSPDAQWIAVVYQGNVWVVNVESGIAHQMSFDGGSENPVWSQ